MRVVRIRLLRPARAPESRAEVSYFRMFWVYRNLSIFGTVQDIPDVFAYHIGRHHPEDRLVPARVEVRRFEAERRCPDRLAEAYGGNLERLREIKARYDPANLFRVNHNIQPQRVTEAAQ